MQSDFGRMEGALSQRRERRRLRQRGPRRQRPAETRVELLIHGANVAVRATLGLQPASQALLACIRTIGTVNACLTEAVPVPYLPVATF